MNLASETQVNIFLFLTAFAENEIIIMRKLPNIRIYELTISSQA